MRVKNQPQKVIAATIAAVRLDGQDISGDYLLSKLLAINVDGLSVEEKLNWIRAIELILHRKPSTMARITTN